VRVRKQQPVGEIHFSLETAKPVQYVLIAEEEQLPLYKSARKGVEIGT
jgi:hypothetical protein